MSRLRNLVGLIAHCKAGTVFSQEKASRALLASVAAVIRSSVGDVDAGSDLDEEMEEGDDDEEDTESDSEQQFDIPSSLGIGSSALPAPPLLTCRPHYLLSKPRAAISFSEDLEDLDSISDQSRSILDSFRFTRSTSSSANSASSAAMIRATSISSVGSLAASDLEQQDDLTSKQRSLLESFRNTRHC